MTSIRELFIRFLINQPRVSLDIIYGGDTAIYILTDGINRIYIDSVMTLIILDRNSSYFRTFISRFDWKSSDGQSFFAAIMTMPDFLQEVKKLVYHHKFLSRGEGNDHFYDETIDTSK